MRKLTVRDGRVVAPGRHGDRDEVFCLNTDTGELLWKGDYEAPGDDLWGGGPRATPSIDGDRAYTFGRMGHLACWDMKDGKLCWMTSVEREGGQAPLYGHSSSPLVYKDLVIVQGGARAQTIAFRKKDGSVAWRSNTTGVAGYATPVFARISGREQIVVFNGSSGKARDGHTPGRVAGLDVRSGGLIWESPWWCKLDVFATTPVAEGDRVLVAAGYNAGCKFVEVRRTGAVTVWEHWNENILASLHSAPIILDGYLYGYSGMSGGRGELQCVELSSGKLLWSAGTAVGWGTLLLVDGHLLCLSNQGGLFLVEATPKTFTKVAELRSAIPGDCVWTAPAVADGKAFLRFKKRLICYDLRR